MTGTPRGAGSAGVPEKAAHAEAAGRRRERWGGAEPVAWTDRMSAAPETGVRGGKWSGLLDTVCAERTPAVAWGVRETRTHVRREGGLPASLPLPIQAAGAQVTPEQPTWFCTKPPAGGDRARVVACASLTGADAQPGGACAAERETPAGLVGVPDGRPRPARR